MCVFVCVCVGGGLVIQHVKRIRRIAFSFLTRPVLPRFLHHVKKGTIFEKKKKKTLFNIKCVFSVPLQRLPETFLILKINQRAIIINVRRVKGKVAVILFRC